MVPLVTGDSRGVSCSIAVVGELLALGTPLMVTVGELVVDRESGSDPCAQPDNSAAAMRNEVTIPAVRCNFHSFAYSGKQ